MTLPDKDEIVDKLKDKKFAGILASLGIGASVAVSGVGDDTPTDDADADLQHPVDSQAPSEVQEQVDENKQKLDTLTETATEGKKNYQLLGC